MKMIVIRRARKLSPSNLKPLLSFSFSRLHPLSTTTGTATATTKSLLNPTLPKYTSSFFFTNSISSSTNNIKSVPFTRDGNYDDATSSTAVCPGCGIHIQDSDPNHPGFFIKPSASTKIKRVLYQKWGAGSIDETEFTDSIKRGVIAEPDSNPNPEDAEGKKLEENKPPVVCARCHSLRHYGRVKDPMVENLLPDFDFDHTVGRKLGSISGTRTVVLMVVDASDFDGSFPKKVAKLVSDTMEENHSSWKEGKSGNTPRVVLVVTKIDLLPSSLSPTRFEHWVRQRAREGGLSRIAKLHFVSPVRDWGIKGLVEDVAEMAGKRGRVWAVGSQNAGKSTLINAIGKAVSGKLTFLTEAPVPGTTLGIIRIDGVLGPQAKLFDTPGLLNPHQITTRLTREEQKLVSITKELKPRTYRIQEGHTIYIGGLMRLDIEECSVDSIYVTVWASPYLPLYMGKTENAAKMLQDHFGTQLQPPIGENRVKDLGEWVRHEFHVSGNTWESSSVDIASAGLGWFAIGIKGEALLGVWTYEGIDVFLRNPLLPHRSQTFEVAGFSVSKIVAKADKASNKLLSDNEKRHKLNKFETIVSAAEAESAVINC